MTFKEWLTTKFTNYEIMEEIKFANTNPNKYIIISGLGGDNVYSIGYTQNVQLTIRTDDPLTTKEELKQFSIDNSGTYIDIDTEWQLKVLCNFPYKAQAFQDGKTNGYYYEFILPIFLITTKNTEDIEKLLVDGERIDIQGFDMAYITQTDNQRVAQTELNKTNITLGNLQITFRAVSVFSVFNTKVRSIMTGNLPKDTSFTIKLNWKDGTSNTFSMKLTGAAHHHERTQLPTREYTFML